MFFLISFFGTSGIGLSKPGSTHSPPPHRVPEICGPRSPDQRGRKEMGRLLRRPQNGGELSCSELGRLWFRSNMMKRKMSLLETYEDECYQPSGLKTLSSYLTLSRACSYLEKNLWRVDHFMIIKKDTLSFSTVLKQVLPGSRKMLWIQHDLAIPVAW